MPGLIPTHSQETYAGVLSSLNALSLVRVFWDIEEANLELHNWRLTLVRGAEEDKAESAAPVTEHPFLIGAGYAAGYHALTSLGLRIPRVPGTYLGDSTRFPESDLARGEDTVHMHFWTNPDTQGYLDAASEWATTLAHNDNGVSSMVCGFTELYIAAERLIRDNVRVSN